ncbi:UDP-N-acetylmuramoyl-L-alanyl-D-glutamate--2,6-diaminopimelate ligase [Jeotgalibacillus sp. R-1-5s-1]|uniref:UDP-N-acetylmuramoyl-L-alanyl-D-glutamate--2, 6-diaminopimelate ligase n=1 Tax=Jeotgalibacillus sp. R-1-5s-1 TaxID=2555897 RepID=UPI00106AC449|nr:UDP-N-acetylmuramoyl-L-alanyl-D-glutamate--2,6-diaminopimelate ligase [Jeotgalibacillus sp. R-1-5s-1]TFD97557.1 UDP-N-acetylmuramoyl-L-alanyl-D-glutamate--2,6-diaminopimelate ligase [Jeotgalibacillus sp. R-1-5s-1]
MKTTTLFHSLKMIKQIGELPEKVTSLETDSRKVLAGSVFICIKGYTVDGHDYARQAAENGAAVIVSEKELDLAGAATQIVVKSTERTLAVLADRFFQSPSEKLTVFGVTGTNGKTSVTNLIHALLKASGQKAALSGTIGFNLDGELHQSANTTSDLLTTQRMMQTAIDHRIPNMIFEVSSHGLVEGRLWGVDFDVAVFTNLSHDHLDYHGTMEHYGYAKGLLFSQMGQDLTKDKAVVLNLDDEWFERYAQMTPFDVISYSMERPADFYAENIEYLSDRTLYTLHSPEGVYQLETQLLGTFNVSNTLAAIAALYAKGYKVSELVELLRTIAPVSGRMERVPTDAPLSIYIDYAHTPDAIEKAIKSVMPFKKNRILFLIGTGGNRDKSKRPAMAEMASLADYVVLTTDDPRYEDYDSITGDLEKGMTHDHYACIGDRGEAVRHLMQQAEPDDIIIFAGKGHEDYQIIENTKYPHSDSQIALEVIKERF